MNIKLLDFTHWLRSKLPCCAKPVTIVYNSIWHKEPLHFTSYPGANFADDWDMHHLQHLPELSYTKLKAVRSNPGIHIIEVF